MVLNLYRINWGNGQVEYVTCKAEGIRKIRGDLYQNYAFIQRYDGYDQWTTVARGTDIPD